MTSNRQPNADNPFVVLQREHQILRQVVHTTELLLSMTDDDAFHAGMQQVIAFFRNFTELYHHPKEALIHNYLRETHRLSGSDAIIEQVVYGREDLDELIADMIDAHMAYDLRTLREETRRYIDLLKGQMDAEENEVLGDAVGLLSADESNMIAREFALQDNRDRLLQGILNNYYKFSNKILLQTKKQI